MGLDGISIWQLLIVLVIVVMLFGTTKLKNAGGDLGSALKNFRRAMRDSDEDEGKKEKGPRDSLSGKSDSTADAEFTHTSEQHTEHSGDRRG